MKVWYKLVKVSDVNDDTGEMLSTRLYIELTEEEFKLIDKALYNSAYKYKNDENQEMHLLYRKLKELL